MSSETTAERHHPLPDDVLQEVQSRLRRIEGQARGVQRMLDKGRDCSEVISQLASIRAATYGASVYLLKHYARECRNEWEARGAVDKPIEDLIDLMLTLSH